MGLGKQLSIVSWNMRGFQSSVPYVRQLIANNDIVLLSEHWLHTNKLFLFDECFEGTEYFARSSRHAGADSYGTGRGQGGVAVLWRKGIGGVVPLNDILHDRICGIRLQTASGTKLNIFSVYFPAAGCGEDVSCTVDEVSGILETRDDDEMVVLGGDFNGDLGASGGPRGSRPPNRQGEKILRLINEYNFHVTNLDEAAQGPVDTFYGPTGTSCIDYFMVPRELKDMVSECMVMEEDPLNTSDHLPVRLILNLEKIPCVASKGFVNRSVNWKKPSYEQIQMLYTNPLEYSVHGLENQMILSTEMLDNLVYSLINKMHQAANNLPKSKFKKHVKPYWSDELSQLKREKILHYERWKREGRPREPDNIFYMNYKSSKKMFIKTLRALSRKYENDQMLDIMKSAELDKFHFWRQIKKVRGDKSAKVLAIKGPDGIVKHNVQDVLKVWKTHFQKIGTPKDDPRYDAEHFAHVNDFVEQKRNELVGDQFSDDPFSIEEVVKAIKELNKGKAPGPDLITSEHLTYAGMRTITILTRIYNLMLEYEYIPTVFRRGTQVPLYKGKNACSLNPSNYRGITLLSTLNKVYEIILWKRMEVWWVTNKKICELQGAGKKGFSCLHSALLLQETLATSLEANKKCFLVYFDVAKAYDTIWINGLFYRLYEMGIVGRTWRMLLKCYDDFLCRVRVMGHFSEWYALACGIHQGGYLSLIKYVAFTSPLLEEIRDSGLCCTIYRTPSAPVGYADDMAAACPSKHNVDMVINMAYSHGCTWRYEFNAEKSAVLSFGETPRERATNSEFREFNLGGQKVKEKARYEHLGIMATCDENDPKRVSERLSKARKVLNVSTGIGVKRKGLNMLTCNVLFWNIVVPTALFGCEVWCLTANDVAEIESFQIYAGKRLQRLHPNTPNICSFLALGWIHLEILILIRKVVFIRTILMMDDDDVIKRIFKIRAQKFCEDPNTAILNIGRSPVFEILHAALQLGMINLVIEFTEGTRYWSKEGWSNIVWKNGWRVCDDRNSLVMSFHKDLDLLKVIGIKVTYATWWVLADLHPEYVYFCETMIKLVCHSSKLKTDSAALKSEPRNTRVCNECMHNRIDSARHMIMECDDTYNNRNEMYNEIMRALDQEAYMVRNNMNMFPILLGQRIEGMSDVGMLRLWIISGSHIHNMYKRRTTVRVGVG